MTDLFMDICAYIHGPTEEEHDCESILDGLPDNKNLVIWTKKFVDNSLSHVAEDYASIMKRIFAVTKVDAPGEDAIHHMVFGGECWAGETRKMKVSFPFTVSNEPDHPRFYILNTKGIFMFRGDKNAVKEWYHLMPKN